MQFGDQKFQYDATEKEYFQAFLPAYAIVFFIGVAALAISKSLVITLFAGLIAGVLIGPFIATRLFRLQMHSVSIGTVRFNSSVSVISFYFVSGAAFLFNLIGLGLFTLMVQAYLGTPAPGVPLTPPPIYVAYLLAVPLYGVMLFSNMMFHQVLLFRWKAETLQLENLHTLTEAVASGQIENPVGMGLADALDVGFEGAKTESGARGFSVGGVSG